MKLIHYYKLDLSQFAVRINCRCNYVVNPTSKSPKQHHKVLNHFQPMPLTWQNTWPYVQTSTSTYIGISDTLRDALVGSVLFLSAIPILPPAVGFRAPYPPACLLLIKQAPGGRGEGGRWCRRRAGLKEGGVGVSMCISEMSHPLHVSAHPPVWNKLLHRGICAQLQSACIFTTHSSLCHTLPLPFTVSDLSPVRAYCMAFLFRSRPSKDGL